MHGLRYRKPQEVQSGRQDVHILNLRPDTDTTGDGHRASHDQGDPDLLFVCRTSERRGGMTDKTVFEKLLPMIRSHDHQCPVIQPQGLEFLDKRAEEGLIHLA